jgi:hypothetical protein
MNCIFCGCPGSSFISKSVPHNYTNEFNRKEVSFTVETHTNVEWKDGKFHCNKCGKTFSFNEGVMQKAIPDQQKLFYQ